MPKSTKPRYGWVYAPAKAAPPSVPAALKRNSRTRRTHWWPHRSAGPHALGGQFETKFARMKYTSGALFDLAYMRYTDAWFELFDGKTLEECLESIESDAWFRP